MANQEFQKSQQEDGGWRRVGEWSDCEYPEPPCGGRLSGGHTPRVMDFQWGLPYTGTQADGIGPNIFEEKASLHLGRLYSTMQWGMVVFPLTKNTPPCWLPQISLFNNVFTPSSTWSPSEPNWTACSYKHKAQF